MGAQIVVAVGQVVQHVEWVQNLAVLDQSDALCSPSVKYEVAVLGEVHSRQESSRMNRRLQVATSEPNSAKWTATIQRTFAHFQPGSGIILHEECHCL